MGGHHIPRQTQKPPLCSAGNAGSTLMLPVEKGLHLSVSVQCSIIRAYAALAVYYPPR